MTKKFDDDARNDYENRLLYDELEYNNMPVRDMVVMPVSVGFARPYISKYHYSKTMPDSTMYVYAGFYDERLAGIVCFGTGVSKNQFQYIYPHIKKGEYVELTRLWSPDGMPRNTESRLVSKSMKMLPDKIKIVLSFADDMQNHKGYIYQALSFYYLGINDGGKMIETEDGIIKHPRLLGIYKMRHPEYRSYSNDELMNILKYKYVQSGKKHRYLYIRGKNNRKEIYPYIKGKITDYPKIDSGLYE